MDYENKGEYILAIMLISPVVFPCEKDKRFDFDLEMNSLAEFSSNFLRKKGKVISSYFYAKILFFALFSKHIFSTCTMSIWA